MSFSRPISKASRELALTVGLALAFSSLFNFVWESVHSVSLYGGHDFGAGRYVRMVGYASGVDALLVLGIFFFIGLAWRNAFWLKTMNSLQVLVVLLAGMLVSGLIEYRAVYILKEWRYGPDMPLILGIGLSPLVQIGVTGLLTFRLTARLLYRCGPYSAGGAWNAKGGNGMKTLLTHAVWISAVSLFSCSPADRYGPMTGPGGGWPMMHYGCGGWFMWLILIIVVAIAIYVFVQTQKGANVRETPLEILRKRYAKGEITKDEFDRMKRDLSE
jgi:putative membrane protein